MIGHLSHRSQEVLGHVVEAYVETGEPIGSKTLSSKLGLQLSPATLRNVMADLERQGYLYSPHTSAGRLPTEKGLRLFVHGLLEIGKIDSKEAHALQQVCQSQGLNYEAMFDRATQTLSGLSQCAGLVLAPKTEEAVKHIEFVSLSPGRALVVLVFSNGVVENRIVDIPANTPSSTLTEVSNYLNDRLRGKTLSEVAETIQEEISSRRASLDTLASSLIETGMAIWSGEPASGSLIVRGQAHLLRDVNALQDIERVRILLEELETRNTFVDMLQAAISAEGVQIFIGAENHLFNLTGCSLITAPFKNEDTGVVGAIGVIGPTRMNYAKVIPMVDYTAKIITKLLGS